MNDTYKKDYGELELSEDADWETAREAYRRRVKRWHPDRYGHSPRERVHAEKRFIELSRSFDRLRQYYRANQRLPLQPGYMPPLRDASGFRPGAGYGDEHDSTAEPPSSADFDPNVLRRHQQHSELKAKSGARRLRRRAGIAFALLVATLAVVTWVDMNERAEAQRISQSLRRGVVPSEFLQSEPQGGDASSRGRFLEGEERGMGEQLMPDIFR